MNSINPTSSLFCQPVAVLAGWVLLLVAGVIKSEAGDFDASTVKKSDIIAFRENLEREIAKKSQPVDPEPNSH